VLIGAPLNFIILQRIPRGRSFRERSARHSILALDLALLLVFGVPMLVFGVGAVLATYLPVMIMAAWIGNWLFYVQHQFDGAYWQRDGAWDFHVSALAGGSYFQLPRVLQWFSGNIGLHHIHHLSARVPNYHLQACFDDAPELQGVARRITLRESLGCWKLALWDEQRSVMVRFRDLDLRPA
jgi:acyl-lipid omega-6 desaturase (Delta-12 desaturase)